MTQTQNNQKKNNGLSLVGFVPILTMLIIMAYLLFSFGKNLIKQGYARVDDEYMSITDEIEDGFARDIYAIEYASGYLAEVISGQYDIFNSEVVKHMEHITKLNNVFNVYVVKPDLSAIDSEGNSVENIVSLNGYEDAFTNGNKHKFITNIYGEQVMLIVTALTTDTENKGYIIAEYIPSNVEDEGISIQKKNTYALVDERGNIIKSYGENLPFTEEKGNIIDSLGSATYKRGSFQGFKNGILQQKSGLIEINEGGTGKSIYYFPLENCNASIVLFVDTDIVRKKEITATAEVRRLISTMSIIVFVMIAFLVGYTLYSRAKFNMESDDLKNKADTDQLTQLYNKIATEEKIQEYIQNEGKDSLSMFFILDVDDFKKINDTMGHAFGDKVLVSLGHQIRSWFRMNDIIGRIGGDEFVIFLKDVKTDEIVKKEGNRILQFFSGFTVGEYTRYAPTASIGCALYPRDGQDFESLYKSADKALYKSKKNGKNQLTFYSEVDKKEGSEAAEQDV